MMSGQLRNSGAPDATTDPTVAPEYPALPTTLGVTEPGPDEPLAVVATGPAGPARREVLAALLDVAPTVLAVPEESWLVVRYAPASTRVAWVPGYRQPHPYGVDAVTAGPAPARPPRRVELHLPAPLLRHTAVVDVPDPGTLGTAGVRVLLDAVGRGGALLFVVPVDQVFGRGELDLLTTVARSGTTVLFLVTAGADDAVPAVTAIVGGTGVPDAVPAVTATAGGTGVPDPDAVTAGTPPPAGPPPAGPPPAGPWPDGGRSDDPVEAAVRALRATLVAAVPELAAAPWFPIRTGRGGDGPSGSPAGRNAADVDALRQALVGWAGVAGPRRLGSGPPAVAGTPRRVPVPAGGADDQGWAERLDRQARSHARRIGQHLALELANIHLRAVQEIVFGAGCAGLPRALDREVHALSLLVTAHCDLAVRWIVRDAFAAVFGVAPDEASYRRVCVAVRAGLSDHRPGRGVARVLLVTSTGGVADLSGAGAFRALDCHPGAARDAVLPPVAVALSAASYSYWRGPGNAGPDEARSWVQRVLREIGRELQAELSRRFEAVRLALGAVLADAVDHGILLA